MKKLIYFLFTISMLSCDNVVVAQTIDSTYIKEPKKKLVCDSVSYDSSYWKVTVTPASGLMVKGMYGHPDQVTIGSQSSENSFLIYLKNKDVNELNMYCRSYLYDATKRSQLAAFVRKAKEQYGINKVTVDVRLTNNKELPGWKAYFSSYAGTISMIEPLAEFEPYTLKKKSDGTPDPYYDDLYLPTYESKYKHFFYVLQTMGKLCDQNNVWFNWYEGWVGKNYSNPQAAVDSMVKYCDAIYISNYVSVADFNSTASGYGEWDNRADKRCEPIASACKRQGKINYPIIDIESLEPSMLFNIYACPESSTKECHSFYGSTFQRVKDEFNKSATDVILYLKLIGRTMFYSKYCKLAQP